MLIADVAGAESQDPVDFQNFEPLYCHIDFISLPHGVTDIQ